MSLATDINYDLDPMPEVNMSEDQKIMEAIMDKLSTVVDPEIGVPITEMKLVDEVKVEEGNALIVFHLTMPFCPSVFALQIARDIKEKAKAVDGVRTVKVNLVRHVNADEINKAVNG
jgi:ATP-binding protein involved in chromosome partitioning